MPDIEELEHRITRLESLYEDVLKERLTAITARLDRLDARVGQLDVKVGQLDAKVDQLNVRVDKIDVRLDQLYEKTERDKTELKTELISRISAVLTKTDKDKRDIICWMAGLGLGFLTLAITAMWAILSFALKQ